MYHDSDRTDSNSICFICILYYYYCLLFIVIVGIIVQLLLPIVIARLYPYIYNQ